MTPGDELILCDVSALRSIGLLLSTARDRYGLIDGLTLALENGRLGFPREVVKELQVIAREEQITIWASGQMSELKQYMCSFTYYPVAAALAEACGFPRGFDNLDGRDPSIAAVVALAAELNKRHVGFVIASEDTGKLPLRPSMEAVARQATWQMINGKECIYRLGLDAFL